MGAIPTATKIHNSIEYIQLTYSNARDCATFTKTECMSLNYSIVDDYSILRSIWLDLGYKVLSVPVGSYIIKSPDYEGKVYFEVLSEELFNKNYNVVK